MYAMISAQAHAACTPAKDSDDPASRAQHRDPCRHGSLETHPGVYERIGPAMEALEELAAPADPARPLVECYRRHDLIEL